MALDGKIRRRALDRFAMRNATREHQRNAKRNAVYADFPRLRELDRLIAHSMIDMAETVTRGSTDGGTFEEIKRNNLRLQDERRAFLRTHGLDELDDDDVPLCTICGDHGYIGSTPCSCLMELYREEQTRELSQLLNIGAHTFDTFRLEYYPPEAQLHMDTTFKYCRNYAHNFAPVGSLRAENLYIWGGTGVGKTFLSTCIARAVADGGFSVVYDTAINYCAKSEKLKFSRPGDEDLEADVKRYYECDLFILDDLGTELRTAFTVSAVYDIINSRITAKKPMIVNSNVPPQETETLYSPAISSRLGGDFTEIKFIGRDIRKLPERQIRRLT